jgi:hypothetical protein
VSSCKSDRFLTVFTQVSSVLSNESKFSSDLFGGEID